MLTNLRLIVRPASKLKMANLCIEGEKLHVNLARGFENGGWSPNHFAIVVQNSFGHCFHNVVSIRTETDEIRVT